MDLTESIGALKEKIQKLYQELAAIERMCNIPRTDLGALLGIASTGGARCGECGKVKTCAKCTGRAGARASATSYTLKQYKEWGKRGGRPPKKEKTTKSKDSR